MDGWISYMDRRAPSGILCQFMRKEWTSPTTGYRDDIRPEQDIAGLYWKLTAIGERQLEALSPEARMQVEFNGGGLWGMTLSGMMGPQSMADMIGNAQPGGIGNAGGFLSSLGL